MEERVFIVSQTESFLTNRGQRHPDLARYLAANSVEVVYVSSNFYHAEKRLFSKEEISKAKKHQNITQLFINIPGYSKNLGFKRILSNFIFALKSSLVIFKMVKRNDVIVVASRPVEQVFFFSLIKRFKGVKLILDVRDIWPDALNIGNRFVQLLFRAYCNLFLITSVKKFNKIVYTCPSFIFWIRRYTTNRNLTFMPLGYNDARFRSEFINESRSHSGQRVRMVVIGLFQKQLNLIPLIKAVNEFPDITLHFYGDDGTGEMFSAVSAEVSDSKNKNIKICGSVRSDLVPQVLKAYDVGVVPMDAEYALPNKFFDYIAVSLPIYALGNNDATRLVEQNGLGWVSDFTISGINATLLRISEDSEKYNRASSNIFNARSFYGRDHLFKEMVKILLSDGE